MAPGVGLALGAMVLLGLADLAYQRGAAAGVPAHYFLMVQAWLARCEKVPGWVKLD